MSPSAPSPNSGADDDAGANDAGANDKVGAVNVRVVRARDFMRTTVSGDLDFERSRRLLHAALRANPACAYDLLLDLRGAQDVMTYRQLHDLVQDVKREAPSFRQRVAILERWGPDLEKAQFFEADARHEGYDVRAFHRFEEAIDWIFAGR
jgi:hypothetical protein